MALKQKKRVELWNLNPHCHWCGKLTHLKLADNGIQTPSLATVDHLYNRLDSRRAGNEHLQVLACYECNARRGKEFQQAAQRQGVLRAFDPDIRPLINPSHSLTYRLEDTHPELLDSLSMLLNN